MTRAQEALREEVEKINDAETIEKIRIFVSGILAQQSGKFCPPARPLADTPIVRTNAEENQCTLFPDN